MPYGHMKIFQVFGYLAKSPGKNTCRKKVCCRLNYELYKTKKSQIRILTGINLISSTFKCLL